MNFLVLFKIIESSYITHIRIIKPFQIWHNNAINIITSHKHTTTCLAVYFVVTHFQDANDALHMAINYYTKRVRHNNTNNIAKLCICKCAFMVDSYCHSHFAQFTNQKYAMKLEIHFRRYFFSSDFVNQKWHLPLTAILYIVFNVIFFFLYFVFRISFALGILIGWLNFISNIITYSHANIPNSLFSLRFFYPLRLKMFHPFNPIIYRFFPPISNCKITLNLI